jgi:hypothetical protein
VTDKSPDVPDCEPRRRPRKAYASPNIFYMNCFQAVLQPFSPPPPPGLPPPDWKPSMS